MGIDVEHRSEIQVDSDRTQLTPEHLPGERREDGVIVISEHAHRRQLDDRRTQPSNPPALLIDTDQSRSLRGACLLTRIDELRGLKRIFEIATEEDHPSYQPVGQPGTDLARYVRSSKTADDDRSCESLELPHPLTSSIVRTLP